MQLTKRVNGHATMPEPTPETPLDISAIVALAHEVKQMRKQVNDLLTGGNAYGGPDPVALMERKMDIMREVGIILDSPRLDIFEVLVEIIAADVLRSKRKQSEQY